VAIGTYLLLLRHNHIQGTLKFAEEMTSRKIPEEGMPVKILEQATPSEKSHRPMTQVLQDVDVLQNADEITLHRLTLEAAAMLRDNEREFMKYFRHQMKRVEEGSLSRSFFLVRSMLRHGKNLDPLIPVLDQKHIHETAIAAEGPDSLNYVKGFILSELRERIHRGEQVPHREQISDAVVRLARNETDLAVVDEALQLLPVLTEDGAHIRDDLLKERSSEEINHLMPME
jgi:hypothetical protein